MTDLPVNAFVSKDRSVTYVFADGHTVTLRGNHPYRDTNPGNLSYGGRDGEARARAAGAIGVDPTGAYNFAIFPSEAAGEAAFQALIARHVAAGDTVEALMKRYAPAGDNNTTAYIKAIETAINGKAGDKLSTLTSGQLDILKETIRVSEGWRDRHRETSPPVVTPAR